MMRINKCISELHSSKFLALCFLANLPFRRSRRLSPSSRKTLHFPNSATLAGLPKRLQENFAVSIITKNRFQSVATVHHVIQRPFQA